MAIAEKRVELRSQTTNVATKDFTTIKSNNPLNIEEKDGGLLDELGGLTDGAGDLLGGVSDAVNSAKGAVGDAVKGAMSAVDGVKKQVDGAMKQVNAAVGQVKGAINQATSMANQAMSKVNNLKGMVERVCKNPSLSSLSGIGSSLSNLTKNMPGLDSGPLGKLADTFGSEVKGALGGISSGVSNFVSNSGFMSKASSLTSGTFDTLSKAVKDVTGKDGLLGTVQRSVSSFTNSYQSLYNVAASTKIPGIFGGSVGGKSIAEITGMNKAASKVLGAINNVKGTMNYLETTSSQIGRTINSFSGNVVNNITSKFTTSDPNTRNLKDGVSTITKAQQTMKSMCYKSSDGLFSTNTSNGSNSEWTAAAMTSGSNYSSSTNSSGVVQGTSKQTLLALSETIKTNDKIKNLNISTNSKHVSSYLTSSNKTYNYSNNENNYLSYDSTIANMNKYRNTPL